MAVTLNYQPHAAQRTIHEARGVRFRTVCTGRRFGKTLCLAAELLDRGGCEQGGDYGWVAPTYNVADRGIEAFRTIADGFVKVVGRAPARVEFAGPAGSVRIWFLSADNPDNIRGYGFQGLVIDEAAAVPKKVWQYVLRPTISQTLGWAVFVSTPKGRNWFYDLHTRGLDPFENDYASFVFPSKASPYFPASEWEDARRTLPEDVFRQEYMAEFLEDSAGVFRNVDGCLVGDADIPHPGKVRDVVIGCDVAKHTDFTVLIAMDAETGRCFAIDRFNHLDWPVQRERILGFVSRYRGRLILDATGLGDPIYDDLKRVYADVEPFKLTASSKLELIQRLIVAVEQQRVSWPGTRACGTVPGKPASDWDTLTNEMKRFEYVISGAGRISYGAPSGYHDDSVIALALANHRRWESENVGRMMTLQSASGGVRSRVRPRPRRGARVMVG